MSKLTITNECNMDLMKRYPDNHFDLAIVDPPYFEEYGKEIYPGKAISTTGVKRNRFESKHWEVPGEQYFNELYRVSKHQIIWGINYYEQFANSVGRLIWDKVNDSSTFSKAEIASCSLIKSVQMFRYKWNGMLQQDMKNKEVRIHPTQKPVALYKWLLENYANPGDKILDTYLGSGSIAIACHDYGFELTACELDPKHFERMMKRVNNHVAQTKLFF